MASESVSGSRSQVDVAIAFLPRCSADKGFLRESGAFDGDIDCDPDSDTDYASIGRLCRGGARETPGVAFEEAVVIIVPLVKHE